MLHLNPCFPKAWPKLEATVTLGDFRLSLILLNPEGTGHGIVSADLDGTPLPPGSDGLTLPMPGGAHRVTVILGKPASSLQPPAAKAVRPAMLTIPTPR
jgi:cyclic beta-1,2-glucan synthetase